MLFTRQNVSLLAEASPSLRSEFGDGNRPKCRTFKNRFLIRLADFGPFSGRMKTAGT